MDHLRYDVRKYRSVAVRDGYGEWAATYDDPVLDLLDCGYWVGTVPWRDGKRAADLACGTGRIGVWLKERVSGPIDGVDLTPEMLEQARSKVPTRASILADVARTPLPDDAYDLITAVLVDEHLASLDPLYEEAARIACAGSRFVLVGYHPFFLINGIPTHYDSASGEPLAIECFTSTSSATISSLPMRRVGSSTCTKGSSMMSGTGVQTRKWRRFLDQPVSFAMVWQLGI
ncbi:MAG: class I SAM-dependent methyltransferase [Thermomicrobiales bacterium]